MIRGNRVNRRKKGRGLRRRLLSFLLVMATVLTMVPSTAFFSAAKEAETEAEKVKINGRMG